MYEILLHVIREFALQNVLSSFLIPKTNNDVSTFRTIKLTICIQCAYASASMCVCVFVGMLTIWCTHFFVCYCWQLHTPLCYDIPI